MTLLAGIIIGVAFAVHVAFGFGGALLALPLLTQMIGVRDSVTLILLFQTLTGVQIFWIYKKVPFAKLKSFLAFTVLGVIGGVFFLSRMPGSFLETFLGLYLILYVLIDVFHQRKALPPLKLPPGIFSTAAGLIGGTISGAIGVGGPVLISYLKKLHLSKESLRATIIFTLLIANVLRMTLTGQLGMFNEKILHYAVYALPFFVMSFFLGQWIMKSINEKIFHLSINIMLLLSGIALLAEQFYP